MTCILCLDLTSLTSNITTSSSVKSLAEDEQSIVVVNPYGESNVTGYATVSHIKQH